MEKTNNKLDSILTKGFIASLENYESSNDGNTLGDLYVCYNKENGLLNFFDDMEKPLHSINLKEENKASDWEKDNLSSIKRVLENLEKDGFFDKEFIFKPFTVSLTNESFIVSEELIFIDDETMKIDNDLWNKLDEELDIFLKDLMK